MKRIKIGKDKFFVINPNSGKWGIANRKSTGELEIKLDEQKPTKEYFGTELLVLNSSNKCNLSCVYCSESAHRRMVPQMPLEIAYRILEKAIEEKELSKIVFHGSEPTCNFNWIKDVVKHGQHLMEKSNNKLEFSIQSNLATIPGDFIEFIKKYQIGVSTSIDGTEKIHNITRPYLNGRASFENVLENSRKILETQRSLNVTTVVTKYNQDNLKELRDFLEGEKFTSWQIIPVQRNPDLSPDPKRLGEEYISLFNQTFKRVETGKQKLDVRILSQYLTSMFNLNGIDACRICSSGKIQPLMAIDHEGETYPCDYFWGDERAKMGNINQSQLSSLSNNPTNLRMRSIDNTPCEPCDWKMICGGGCLAESKNTKNGKPFYCQTHEMVYSYLAKKMPELIKKNLIKPVISWLNK